jgi:hypothetical protein
MMSPFWSSYCLELPRAQDGWPSTTQAKPRALNVEGSLSRGLPTHVEFKKYRRPLSLPGATISARRICSLSDRRATRTKQHDTISLEKQS